MNVLFSLADTDWLKDLYIVCSILRSFYRTLRMTLHIQVVRVYFLSFQFLSSILAHFEMSLNLEMCVPCFILKLLQNSRMTLHRSPSRCHRIRKCVFRVLFWSFYIIYVWHCINYIHLALFIERNKIIQVVRVYLFSFPILVRFSLIPEMLSNLERRVPCFVLVWFTRLA